MQLEMNIFEPRDEIPAILELLVEKLQAAGHIRDATRRPLLLVPPSPRRLVPDASNVDDELSAWSPGRIHR